jgi:hypothetical protein
MHVSLLRFFLKVFGNSCRLPARDSAGANLSLLQPPFIASRIGPRIVNTAPFVAESFRYTRVVR